MSYFGQDNTARKTPSLTMRLALAFGGGIFICVLVGLPNLRGVLRGHSAAPKPSADTPSPQMPDSAGTSVNEQNDLVSSVSEASEEGLSSERIRWVQTISVLPTEEHQLQSAHRLARRNACEPIPPNEPIMWTRFQPYLTQRDYREYTEKVPALSRRQQIFSVGLDMIAADQRNLPKVSARGILTYLRSNYITLQVRIQKEPLSGELFLHHRSLAGVAQYRTSRLTQQPTEGLGKTLQNYRSLGLYLAEGQEPVPENLRTLVLLHKGDQPEATDGQGSDSTYEFVFVRARATGRGDSRTLELHTFATSERRQKLHYFKPGIEPSSIDRCSFREMIYFTDYSYAGLYPVESVSRDTLFNDEAMYTMQQLEEYAASRQWEGRVLQNITKLLDALIDRKISD